MKYKKLKPQTVLRLRDMQTALKYGSVKADRRLQVVMPSAVVSALDSLFPDSDRSKILTQLTIDFILEHHYFSDKPELAAIIQGEQAGLDTMLTYLEDREQKAIQQT